MPAEKGAIWRWKSNFFHFAIFLSMNCVHFEPSEENVCELFKNVLAFEKSILLLFCIESAFCSCGKSIAIFFVCSPLSEASHLHVYDVMRSRCGNQTQKGDRHLEY